MPRSPRHHPRPPVARPSHGDVVAVTALLDEHPATLSANLVTFGRILRGAGFDVTAARLIDAGRSLGAIGPASIEDIRAALCANLVSEQSQIPIFDLLFDRYWRQNSNEPPSLPVIQPEEREPPPRPGGESRSLVVASPRPAHAPEGDNPEATAGSTDMLTAKDFASYTDADLVEARRVVRAIAPRLASALSRRRRRSARGDDIDLRRSLRHAARHGGEVVRLIRRRRRVRRLRLAVVCDVSGSMDLYSRQLVQFLFAIQNELRGVSTFVFSTRLHDITPLLKTRAYDEALQRIGRDVDAWSGGTSIGRCLAQFERTHARRRIDSRTVLVIISDGWERGDVEELRRAMAALRRRARRVVWLNPLLGHPDYKPAARGMAAALPYVDVFLPAHSLDALARAVRTLGSLSGG